MPTKAATPIPRGVGVVLAVIFSDACNQFLVFPFVPFLVRSQLHLEADDPNVPFFSGLLAAAYLLGQFVCSPFYGGLSERNGRRPVLLACVAISTCFLFAFGFSEVYWLSVGLRFMQGAFAGALTVGKLYLSDVSDSTNEGRVFSFIGIAIGSGCICGPAIGGYLADPSIMELFGAGTPVGALVRAYPYLPPSVAGGLVSIAVFIAAFLTLRESHPPVHALGLHASAPARMTVKLGVSLLSDAQPGASASVGAGLKTGLPPDGPGRAPTATAASAAHLESGMRATTVNGGAGGAAMRRNPSSEAELQRVHSNSFLEAMTSQASRSSLVVSDDDERSCPSSPSYDGSAPKAVSAVTLAAKYATSPKMGRADLFKRPVTPSPPPPSMGRIVEHELTDEQRKVVFWIVQLACLLFTATNVGLTEVLPVWLSTPAVADPSLHGVGGLGLLPSAIGNLQSTTGVGNIVLALFVTYRIIGCLGPVNTFIISLCVNACAALGPPLVQGLPFDAAPWLSIALMCVSYSLVAVSRNMMFATALMLSKEAALGQPGVAIGINQSACSLGAALGPMLAGLAYTQSLLLLRTCAPFFLGVCAIGALPSALMQARAPRWPWRTH